MYITKYMINSGQYQTLYNWGLDPISNIQMLVCLDFNEIVQFLRFHADPKKWVCLKILYIHICMYSIYTIWDTTKLNIHE
jgi:hypothetical protein